MVQLAFVVFYKRSTGNCFLKKNGQRYDQLFLKETYRLKLVLIPILLMIALDLLMINPDASNVENVDGTEVTAVLMWNLNFWEMELVTEESTIAKNVYGTEATVLSLMKSTQTAE
jgi:hypothetical protein